MAGSSKEELKALQRANQRAHMATIRSTLAGDMEAVRAAFWNRIPEQLRVMVCYMAGLDKTKGKKALRDLCAGDRAKVNAQLRFMLPHLENMQRCATGGKTRDHGEMAGHEVNGIAAIEQLVRH